jgi:hypothetical protein
MFFSRSRENLFKAKVRRQNEEVGMGGPTNNFCLLPSAFCLSLKTICQAAWAMALFAPF